MKKEYESPELEKVVFLFDEILNEVNNVSRNESGSSEYNDDDKNDW